MTIATVTIRINGTTIWCGPADPDQIATRYDRLTDLNRRRADGSVVVTEERFTIDIATATDEFGRSRLDRLVAEQERIPRPIILQPERVAWQGPISKEARPVAQSRKRKQPVPKPKPQPPREIRDLDIPESDL